jgi:hypothetical protein
LVPFLWRSGKVVDYKIFLVFDEVLLALFKKVSKDESTCAATTDPAAKLKRVSMMYLPMTLAVTSR